MKLLDPKFKNRIHKPQPLRGFWKEENDPGYRAREAKIRRLFRDRPLTERLTPAERLAKMDWEADWARDIGQGNRLMRQISSGYEDSPAGPAQQDN